jgi:hypothetical protein
VNPERNLSPGYAEGQVTSVPGFVTSISYWPNGMRNQLVHTNNIADTQTLEHPIPSLSPKTSYARPASFGSGVYDACALPVITTQPQGGEATTASPSVTMSVTLGAGSNATYQWYRQDLNGQVTLITGATGSSYTASPLATTYYYVAVINSCRTLNSTMATVSYNQCLNPTANASLTLNADRSVTLKATGGGTGPLTYTWYRATDNAVVGNAAIVTVGPITTTTSYYAKVTNPCGGTGATSSTITAVIPLPMPSTGLVADLTGTNQITVTWPGVTGAGRYHLERKSGGAWTDLTQSTTYTSTTYVDSGLTANKTYAYRVWVSPDAFDSSKSTYSNVDVATTMAFTSVTSGMLISYTHMEQLLAAVNAVRAAAGWAAVSWNNILASNQPLPSPNVAIVPAHILATRGRMNEALQALGVVTGGYTDPDPALKRIQSIHIWELQRRAQ